MNNSNFVEGVDIIAKYIPEGEKDSHSIQAGHDQIWFGAYEWVTDEKDKSRLEEIGWFEDEDSWSCFT